MSTELYRKVLEVVDEHIDESEEDPRDCMVHLLRCVVWLSHFLPPKIREQLITGAFVEAIAIIPLHPPNEID